MLKWCFPSAVAFPCKNHHHSNENDHPFQSMMRGWLSFMVPLACVAWIESKSLLITGGAFFAPPALVILQGTIGILKYRLLYGDAPLPQSPAHGAVVVHPEDNDNNESGGTNARRENNQESGCQCSGGRRWRGSVSGEEKSLVQKALEEPPIRLLVIGDSLAIGVGTERSCTPLLPEVIAKTLSKAMGGRAVFWTCHGAPGASAGWIVRELESGVQSSFSSSSERNNRGNEEQKEEPNLELSETESSLSGDDSSDGGCSSASLSCTSEEADECPAEWQEWRVRLRRHRKGFDPDVIDPYDIAVVLTGPNDLKSAFFPFLLSGEDAEFRKQAKERGGSYANELRRLLDVLRQRMKQSMDQVRDNVMEVRDNIMEQMHLTVSPRNSQRLDTEDEGVPEEPYETTPLVNNSTSSHEKTDSRRPLVVLPGMPARALPCFQTLPLRWLAVPTVATMDNHKRELARSHPGEVMFVEAPSVSLIAEFEAQQGHLWNQRVNEDTLLALRDISKSTCESIEGAMRDYYGRKNKQYGGRATTTSTEKGSVLQHNPPVPPLSARPGAPGSKIFSVDNVHPTDEGYDFWGRHIADAIVKEWHP